MWRFSWSALTSSTLQIVWFTRIYRWKHWTINKDDDAAIVKVCKITEKWRETSTTKGEEIEEPREPEGEFTKIICASQVYHAYRQIWRTQSESLSENKALEKEFQ